MKKIIIFLICIFTSITVVSCKLDDGNKTSPDIEYTVTFNSNGGSYIEPQKVKKDELAVRPKNPTKEGYDFNNWYSDSSMTSIYNFSTKVTSDITLYALWSISSYTITFNSDGGSEVSSQTVNHNEFASKPNDPTKEGYTFEGWYSDPSYENLFDFNTKITHNKTLYAKWVENPSPVKQYYTVTFNSNGGSTIASLIVEENKTAPKPANPTKTGYTFSGWYTDTKLTQSYDFTLNLTTNIILYAKWEINHYTITFNSNGGSTIASLTVEHDDLVNCPTNPTKTGYTFSGWYTDEELTKPYNFDSSVVSNITLYAKWNEIVQTQTYNVNFNTDGGSTIASLTVEENKTITKPTNPTKEGYTFIDWYTSSDFKTIYSFDSKVTSNLTLYAKWEINSYTIKFDVDGGTQINSQTIEYNKTAERPKTNPEKNGYAFVDWYADEKLTQLFDFNAKITEDKTIYAKWQEDKTQVVITYTVTFDSNGGSKVDEAVVKENEKVLEPKVPTKTGYTFIGWYANSGLTTNYDFNLKITKDLTLYAKWEINSYIINFDVDGGSSVTSQTVEYNKTLTRPANPTKEGYTFVNWYSNSNLTIVYNFDTLVVKDFTLYAKWEINKYIVSFNVDGGSNVSSQTVEYNKTAECPTNPTKTGYTFEGWYTSEEFIKKFDFTTKITKDTIIYAKWEASININEINEDTTYSFNSSDKTVQDNYYVLTSSQNAEGKKIIFNNMIIDATSGKLSDNGGNWFQFNTNTSISFNVGGACKIRVIVYDLNTKYNVVAAGVKATSTAVDETFNVLEAGEVKITSLANGYIGYIYITMTDTSLVPVSIELSLNTIAKTSNTSYGNGIYYNYNAKRVYLLNSTFDSTGLYAKVTYSDSTTEVLAPSELSFSGFSSSTQGKKTITVSYGFGDKMVSANYDVYVVSATPSIVDDVIQVRVSKDYSGTIGSIVDGYNRFTTIGQALDYLKAYETTYKNKNKLMIVDNGTYKEKIEIEIANLTIKGQGADQTIIEYDTLYGTKELNDFTNTTDSTQTIAVRETAQNFKMVGITVSNYWNSYDVFVKEFGSNSVEHRALAMLIQADKVIIDSCKLLGYQDTLEAMTGRSVFINSYISGTTDFIFGTNPTMYFNNCEIRSIYNGSTDGGYITAFKGINKGSNDYVTYGAIFDNCQFTADGKITSANTAIARPWGEYSAVMIMNSTIGAHISKAAYTQTTYKNQRYVAMSNSGVATHPTGSNIKFFEYNNNGLGAISATQAGVVVLTSATEAGKYHDFATIFGTTNGAVKYSSSWIPSLPSQIEMIEITYDLQGGSLTGDLSEQIEKGTIPTYPGKPTMSGKTFVGWFMKDNNQNLIEYDFTTPLTEDTTLYAQYEEIDDNNIILTYSGYDEGLYLTFKETDLSQTAVSYRASGSSSWVNVDKQLIRMESSNKARVDIVGLACGMYDVKIASSLGVTSIQNNITVYETDRSGYAHFNNTDGVGAYKNDGTLKDNAVVVYVTEETKNTVTAIYDGKAYVGLVAIIQAATKANLALDIRIIGEIKTAQWNKIDYNGCPVIQWGGLPKVDSNGKLNTANVVNKAMNTYNEIISAGVNSMSDDLASGITILKGLTNKVQYSTSGNKLDNSKPVFDSYFNMCDVKEAYNITVEGIGVGASLYQWGFEFVKCNSIEVKNLTFNNYTEDACGFEGSTSSSSIENYGNYWVHNCTFNLGLNNWDVTDEQDKGDGDGSTDIKRCHNVTISYTRYNHTHKTNLVGANDSCLQWNLTLHHNYYNECSSRLPLLRQTNVHMYNNYYYKCTTAQDIRANSFAYSEYNYFDSCKVPQKVSTTTAYTGTLIKSYQDYLTGCGSSSATVVSSRTAIISGGNCKPDGSTNYNNWDTNANLFYYTGSKSDVMVLTETAKVPNTAKEYAGAMQDKEKYTSLLAPKAKYTVSYETNGGTSISSKIVEEGENLPTVSTAKTGYLFAGWYLDENFKTAVSNDYVVTKNVTLYAKWAEKTVNNKLCDVEDLETGVSQSAGTTIFDVSQFSFVANCNFSYAVGVSPATSNDANNYVFTKAILPGGGSTVNGYTIDAKENCSITIYYIASDSKFTTQDQSKGGNLKVNGTEVGETGNKSNKIAYAYTFNIVAGQTYVLTSSSNRLVIFGVGIN